MPVFAHCESVRKIRTSLKSLPHEPVVYQWLFPSIPKIILKRSDIDVAKIEYRDIKGRRYYVLYLGIGIDCQQRFGWHITQHHTPLNVKYGTLSTLRRTLSAILGIDMTKSENAVNDLMDTCYIEWNLYPGKAKSDLEGEETCLLDKWYYPLNIQKNYMISKEWKKELCRLRKKHKK